VLELSGYTGGRFVTALDDEGKAAEYELSRQVGFVLKDRATQSVLVPYRQLDSERLYSLEPDTGFGKTLERREIEDELDAELVDRILLAISLGLR
jgi:outer membrane lipopolysaccharide assembly protein LptE/RlpB